MWQTNRRTQPFKVKDNLFIKLFRHYDKCGALCWPVLSDAGSLGSLSLAGGWALLSVPVIIWPLPRGRWGITLPQPRRDTTTKMRGWRSASTSQTGDIEIPAAWPCPRECFLNPPQPPELSRNLLEALGIFKKWNLNHSSKLIYPVIQ